MQKVFLLEFVQGKIAFTPYYHVFTVRRHPSEKFTVCGITFILCENTQCQESLHCYHFVLCKGIQCQESLHCYHFCIVHRHPMSVKSTLLSPLYCAKTCYVREVSIGITFILCEKIKCLESLGLYCYHFVLCKGIQCLENLHCCHFFVLCEDI